MTKPSTTTNWTFEEVRPIMYEISMYDFGDAYQFLSATDCKLLQKISERATSKLAQLCPDYNKKSIEALMKADYDHNEYRKANPKVFWSET